MAVRLQEQLGDDVAVVFVESQGHSPAEVERFALDKKWMGGRSLWTSEAPVHSNARGLPSFVLLDGEGRRILEGNSIAMAKQIEDAISAEIAQRRKGPDGVHKDLRGSARALLRGRYTDAIADAEKLVQVDDPELADAASRLVAEARSRADAQLARVGRLIDAGTYTRADELLGDVEKGVGGVEALEQSAADLRARLDGDELEAERKAERSLQRLEAVLREKGPDGLVRRFERLAQRVAGTKAAARAQHLAALLGG